MQWSNSLKSDITKMGVNWEGTTSTSYTTGLVFFVNGDENSDMRVLIYLEPLEDGSYRLETESSYMIPIKSGTTVNYLEATNTPGDLYYRINLEGDEIKEFPNGGALVIENIRINFNFE